MQDFPHHCMSWMQLYLFLFIFFGVHAKSTAYNKADTYLAVTCVHTASHLLSGAGFQRRVGRKGSLEALLQDLLCDPLTSNQSLFVGAARLYSCLAFFRFGKCGFEGIVYCDPRICDTQILYVIISLAKITNSKKALMHCCMGVCFHNDFFKQQPLPLKTSLYYDSF